MGTMTMWHTSTGIRILTGSEGDLVRAGIIDLLGQIQEEQDGLADPWVTGVRLFDELPWHSRLALLADVADALFLPNVEPPELTAINEATIGALFAHIRINVDIEIDVDGELENESSLRYYWRHLLAGCQTWKREPDDWWVEEKSNQSDDWHTLIEVLENGILWDDDWDMPELFMDVDPELSKARKEKLGIEDDYYVAPAPDSSPKDLQTIADRLRQVLRFHE